MKEKNVIIIITVFTILLVLTACNNKVSSIPEILNVIIEGSNVSLELKQVEKSEFLLSVDTLPESLSDGIRFSGSMVTVKVTEPGTHTLYLYVVKRGKLIGTPKTLVVETYENRLLPPEFNYSLLYGKLRVQLSSRQLGIESYVVELNGVTYESKNGTFEFTPVKGDKLELGFYVQRTNGEKSDKKRVLLDLSEDTPPTVRIKLPSPYTGDRIPMVVFDDWDDSEDIKVESNADGLPLLFDGKYLIPLFTLPAGDHILNIKVTDNGKNVSTTKFEIHVVKKFSTRVPTLYIEEGGAFRKASWQSDVKELELEHFSQGLWRVLTRLKGEQRFMKIKKEWISDGGDLYRITALATDARYLPSIPVFAKKESVRRLTSENILSLYGDDVLFSAGNTYRFLGNVAVWEGKLLRVEPSVTCTFSRGGKLLVKGTMEVDGRKGRISFTSHTAFSEIKVERGGIFIARGVDFKNVSIDARDAAIIVLDDCNIQGNVKISASSVQIYNSTLRGEISFDSIQEFYLLSSQLQTDSLNFSNIKKSTVVNSTLEASEVTVQDSIVQFFDAMFKTQTMWIRSLSSVNLSFGNLSVSNIHVSNASKLYLEGVEVSDNEVPAVVESFSRIIVVNSECCASETSVDDTSEIVIYNSGDRSVQRIR